jgi:FAD/FMN-containing dehydrogenase
MWDDFYTTMSEAQLTQRPRPIAAGQPIYALVEAMGGNEEADADLFAGALAQLMEAELVTDAVLAQSARERDALWAVREDLQPGLAPLRPFVSYDVSMAIADMPRFVASAKAALLARHPDATILFYGHAGDGNLHAIVSIGTLDTAIKRGFDTAVYDAVRDVGGSISAEHGIGVDRADFLGWTRSEAELTLMRKIKHAIDPAGTLNPGKLLALQP